MIILIVKTLNEIDNGNTTFENFTYLAVTLFINDFKKRVIEKIVNRPAIFKLTGVQILR